MKTSTIFYFERMGDLAITVNKYKKNQEKLNYKNNNKRKCNKKNNYIKI
jgi:hypothetical protein